MIRTLIFLLIAILFTTNCRQSKSNFNTNLMANKNDSITNSNKENFQTIKIDTLYGKTFYRITETDSIDILYHFCDASINTIKINKDFIYEDVGQEDIKMYYLEVIKQNDSIIFIGKDNQQYSLSPLKTKKYYWKINNNFFIDSIGVNHIAEYWEPYEKCWGEEAFDMALSVIKSDKNDPIGYLNLGDIYWKKNDTLKAKKAYKNYIFCMKKIKKEDKILKRVYKRLQP